MRYLLVIAGSTQLITALNSLDEIIKIDDQIHIFICSLAVKKKQYTEFENYIKKLVKFLKSDYKIKVINEPEKKYDKVFVPTYWQSHVHQITKNYPKNKMVIFGDGIGVLISKYYYDIQKFKFLRKLQYYIQFLLSYGNSEFILPDRNFILGFEKPKQIQISKRIGFIKKLKKILNLDDLKNLNSLRNKNISIYFGVNLSESSRVSENNEIELTLDFLDKKLENSDILIFKPHPRDSRGKILSISEKIREKYSIDVLILDEYQYIPAELIILKLISINCKFQNLFCFSTLAISLVWLFNYNVSFGFGKIRIKKFFHKKFRNNILNMEKDMNKIIENYKNDINNNTNPK